jgi:hypothetical protein
MTFEDRRVTIDAIVGIAENRWISERSGPEPS